MEARDDDRSGSPCRCSLRLRRRVPGPCARRPQAADQRCRTGRAGGRAGGDRDQLRPAVPRPDRTGAARLVPASAVPVAVQPHAASVGRVDLDRAATARALARRGRRPAQRRHADRCRQLSRLPAAERVRRLRPLRLRQVAAPLRLRRAAGTADRPARLPLGYTIVPANEKEYEPLADLLTGTAAEVVIADKGFWGRDYAHRLAACGTRLLTPDKTRTLANEHREHALASTRLVIESVFANLKEQMRLERHLARTPAGLALR